MQITQKNFYKKFLGRVGENKAAEYLIKLGYRVIAKNFKTHLGEIDIVVLDGETVVFVEVKTRSTDAFGLPSEAVNFKKREKYFKVSEQFLIKNKLLEKQVRFDVVEIQNGEINHIKDAFCM
ncbi:MAG: YraN family protein [Clostridia bacterium]|nr:YraN family protein [Clostridia bacterium]